MKTQGREFPRLGNEDDQMKYCKDDWRRSKTCQRELNQVRDLLSSLENETDEVLSPSTRRRLRRFSNEHGGSDGMDRRFYDLEWVREILEKHSDFLSRPKNIWGTTL